MELRLKVDNKMGKAEEIAAIKEIGWAFAGTDTYLEELFTSEMVNWTAQQIQDDIFPDLMQYMGSTWDLDCEKMKVRTLERSLNAAETEAKLAKNTLERLEEKSERQYSKIKSLEMDVEILKQTIALRNDELVRLKAVLFDYMEDRQSREEDENHG